MHGGNGGSRTRARSRMVVVLLGGLGLLFSQQRNKISVSNFIYTRCQAITAARAYEDLLCVPMCACVQTRQVTATVV